MAAKQVSALTLGNYLKIVSKGAVMNQLSEDSTAWDFIKKLKKGDSEGRQLRFAVRQNYGIEAVGFVPVDGGDYPTAKQSTIQEGVTEYKDMALTIQLENTLISKALSDFSSYGKPLAEEIRAKSIGLSRILSASLYQDGTAVIGTVSGTPTVSVTGDDLVVTLKTGNTDRGFAGWFEFGDKIFIGTAADADSIQEATTSGTIAFYRVEDVDRDNDKITLSAFTSADAELVVTAAGAVGDGDLLYRFTTVDTDLINIDDITLGTTDLNTISITWSGLEALTKTDGTRLNGLTLSGSLAGTRFSASAQPVDSQHFQQALSRVKRRVGANRYKYSRAFMAFETMDALVESRETDVRFAKITDNKRGVTALGYVHGRDSVMFEADEFCPKNRIYMIPDANVIEFHGSDFNFVQPEGSSKFFLGNASTGTGHSREVRAYMEGQGALMAVHPAAISQINNFTV